jgi:hypothetical protein
MRETASAASMMGMPAQGTVAEILDDPAREIFDVIRWFGERGKIFNVHFRNIKGRKLDFTEAFPDKGDIDMPRALAAYRDVGYSYMHARPRAADRRPRPLGCRLRLLLRLYPGAARRAGAAGSGGRIIWIGPAGHLSGAVPNSWTAAEALRRAKSWSKVTTRLHLARLASYWMTPSAKSPPRASIRSPTSAVGRSISTM